MKKTALFFLFLLVSACNDRTLRSIVAASPPKIDGELSEWQTVPVILSDEKTTAFGVMHDTRFLYAAIRCVDEEKIRLFDWAGITMWIDPEDGESKDLELHYPASRASQYSHAPSGRRDAMSDSQGAPRAPEDRHEGVLIIDKRSNGTRVIGHDSADSFSAAAATLNGVLCFEVRIPLHIEQYFPKFSSLAGREKLRIGVSLGWIDPNTPTLESRNSMGGFPRGGRIGRGGRGMYPRTSSNAESEMWVEIVLPKPS